jgi:hypothetical protein
MENRNAERQKDRTLTRLMATASADSRPRADTSLRTVGGASRAYVYDTV